MPATASFDVDWSGVDARVKIRNESTDFAGEFIHNSATLAWSASQSGFSFTSDPAKSHFAEMDTSGTASSSVRRASAGR